MKNKIEFIAFDADDTLWENELYFQELEHKFCHLLRKYSPAPSVSEELFKTEIKNLHIYGYGLKGMLLCMIETICKVTNGEGDLNLVKEILRSGQELLQRPITLLDGVQEVISALHENYKLVLATKGDLFDQKRKISASGLQEYFCHIEIMMDEIAEKGFAAHWKYKGGTADKAIEEWLTELREILESSEVGAVDMLDDIKINLQDKEVHVFTPAGDLKTLPAGATLLDFAYAIHTAVGSRCVGGKVNQRNETLRYVLKNGDQVSILTSNNQQPNADWLNIATTSKARNKIRQFLTEDSRAQAALGKEMLARRFKNWKLELTDEVIHRLQQHYKYKFAIDLYQAIAEEKLDMAEIKEFITRPKEEERTITTPREEVQVAPLSRPISEDVLLIDRNVDNVVYKFARCCNPVFGDDILGFVSIGEGIKIHRSQCKNALDLQRRYPYRIVQAAWTNAGATSYQTVLSIVGREDAGMVTKITEVIAKDPKITLRGLSINSSEGLFDGQITVLVSDTEHLSQLISRLKRIQGVMRVYRHDSVKE